MWHRRCFPDLASSVAQGQEQEIINAKTGMPATVKQYGIAVQIADHGKRPASLL